jgi:hypothetical protein
MLPASEVSRIADMLRRQVPRARIAAAARRARNRLAGDHVPPGTENVLPGVYRTGRDTVMIWPAGRPSPRPSGISCFDGASLRTGPGGFLTRGNISLLMRYLAANPEVTCVHFAGHDLLIVAASALHAYLAPLLQAAHLEAIRIDTSVLAHWPRRFLTAPDAGDTLRLLSRAAASGKALAFTARFSHPRQLQSQLVSESVRRIRGTGAASGPAMPTSEGTVCVTGIADIAARKVFVLRYTQASDPDRIGRPFFAAFEPEATWFTDLKPVPGTAFPGRPRGPQRITADSAVAGTRDERPRDAAKTQRLRHHLPRHRLGGPAQRDR